MVVPPRSRPRNSDCSARVDRFGKPPDRVIRAMTSTPHKPPATNAASNQKTENTSLSIVSSNAAGIPAAYDYLQAFEAVAYVCFTFRSRDLREPVHVRIEPMVSGPRMQLRDSSVP